MDEAIEGFETHQDGQRVARERKTDTIQIPKTIACDLVFSKRWIEIWFPKIDDLARLMKALLRGRGFDHCDHRG